MRAEQVIVTHGNTDFDAFASMLAARRLYPEAAICLSGALSRNVREFARLHAEELETVDASQLELEAIRRLIVVDTVHAVLALCRRYRQSGALVVDSGRLVGAVERGDLDKAVGHELAHAPVKG